jgi:molybdopterin converting factor small subunit
MAGTSQLAVELPPGATIEDLLREIYTVHPRLAAMRKSTLIAVGVEYQNSGFALKEGDEVSLFPPVQGG